MPTSESSCFPVQFFLSKAKNYKMEIEEKSVWKGQPSDDHRPTEVFAQPSGLPLSSICNFLGIDVFLIGSGPSFKQMDFSPLSQPGVLTLGVNNSPSTFRPNLWVAVDPPNKFLRSIWRDPTIQKFIPEEHLDSSLFDSSSWTSISETPRGSPNLLTFASSYEFIPEKFLTEQCVCWGNSLENGGGRSVLLAALKVLFCLGVKNVYLLGVDFQMHGEVPYHFPEATSVKHVYANNVAYGKIEAHLNQLATHFKAAGFHVWNCNPESKLRSFPFIPFSEALSHALEHFPRDLKRERTSGLYERVVGGNDSIDSPMQIIPPPHEARDVRRIDRSKPSIRRSTSGLPTVGRPQGAGVVILSDTECEWLIPWFLERFRKHNPDLPVTLFTLGSLHTPASDYLRWNATQLALECPRPFSHSWFYKPFAIQQSPYSHTLFLDLDCEVRGSVDDALGWSDHGTVAGNDLHPLREYERLFRRDHFYNSGLVAVRNDDPLIGLWCESTMQLNEQLRSDQEIMNLVIYENEIPIIALPEHYHQLRLDGDHPQARVMHWTGPTGKTHIREQLNRTLL